MAFNLEKYLATHMKTHEGAGRKLYQCHLCATTCKTKSGLDAHLAAHENLRKFKCHLCDKAFNLKAVRFFFGGGGRKNNSD